MARLLFAEKGESLCLPTALASMNAKYLRERFMARFNATFRQADPTLKPTAGYWSDAQRFLEDAKEAMATIGITRADLVRLR